MHTHTHTQFTLTLVHIYTHTPTIHSLTHSRSEWRGFHPYNNVLWLSYLATKVSIKAKLKDMSSKSWKRRLEPFIKKIKHYSTAKDVFLNVFSPDAVRKINATIKW